MDEEKRERDIPSPEEATEGDKPLKAQEEEMTANLYPPDINPAVEIGGTAEEQAALREEMDR